MLGAEQLVLFQCATVSWHTDGTQSERQPCRGTIWERCLCVCVGVGVSVKR